jgi:hypothetical protein
MKKRHVDVQSRHKQTTSTHELLLTYTLTQTYIDAYTRDGYTHTYTYIHAYKHAQSRDNYTHTYMHT